MSSENQVVEGLPPVEDVVKLLDAAYGGWGDEELFEWKYNYPGTARDDHHLYIETDSKPTAFARIYHRELKIGSDQLSVVVRGNAAVHQEYQQMGQYKSLHTATERHCESADVDLVMTYNRKDNHSFQTNAKSEWSHAELPLYLTILSPTAALEEYAASVLANEGAIGRLVSLLGDRVRVSVDGDSVSLASLAGESPIDRRGVTVHLTQDALHELVGLVANGASVTALAKRGLSLGARNEISPLPVRTSSQPNSELGDVEVILRGLDTEADREAMLELYRATEREDESVVRFRRSEADIEHMLAHPNLLGTLWLERDGSLVGFAPVFVVRSGSVLEGRVADLCAVDQDARKQLVEGVKAFCQNNGIDVIAMFAPEQPNDQWVRIRRHVLMWNELKNGVDRFSPRTWDIGFYDVV